MFQDEKTQSRQAGLTKRPKKVIELAVAALEKLGIDPRQMRARTLEVVTAPEDITDMPNLTQTMQGMVVCPQCGNVHPGGYSYCLRCGAMLPG